MLVFGTEMHLVTFVFVILETVMFFYQLFHYLYRPQDRQRLWYLILLTLLIVYNITGGLFPDPQLGLSIVTQNIIAYGSGFIMASYFPYYFYKAFELGRLRFHALFGVPLFLILPYIIFFVIAYSFDGNLEFAVRYGIIVPFFYSIILLYAITKSVLLKYRERVNQNNTVEILAVYCAVIPWASMTLLSYFQASQLLEVIITNGGFIIITILFISRAITNARLEYQRLLALDSICNANSASPVENKCQEYQLTPRETEIVQLIREGHTYEKIGERLFISKRTVSKHVQNIFEKVAVTNKVELLNKIDQSSNPRSIRV